MKIDEKHAQSLEKLTNRVEILKHNIMSKDDIYKLIGGWRHDLDRLNRGIERLSEKIYNSK